MITAAVANMREIEHGAAKHVGSCTRENEPTGKLRLVCKGKCIISLIAMLLVGCQFVAYKSTLLGVTSRPRPDPMSDEVRGAGQSFYQTHPSEIKSLLGNQTNHTAVNAKVSTTHPVYLRVDVPGRLGNDLFRYAALRGIAKRNNMTPILLGPSDNVKLLADSFRLQSGIVRNPKDFQRFTWKSFQEAKVATYDNRTESLGKQHTHIRTYLQSFKYFSFISDEVRHDLTFHSNVSAAAKVFLHKSKEKLDLPESSEVTYIGLHARRTDFNKLKARGFISPPLEYYLRAAKYMADKYPNPVFVICSDDVKWCVDNLVPRLPHVIVSEKHSAVEDLAILSHCNHTVISSGSFGWWSAWLAGGTAVYYQGYPIPKTFMGLNLAPEDYYPTQWIAM